MYVCVIFMFEGERNPSSSNFSHVSFQRSRGMRIDRVGQRFMICAGHNDRWKLI